MSEEDIKRIEKKIDVLYKIVSGIEGKEVSNPISSDDYLDELVPLFNLSVDTKLFEEYEKVEKLLMVEFKNGVKVKNKLDVLENDYKTGNFLEKEKDKMLGMVSKQSIKYEALNKMAEHFQREKYDEKSVYGGFLWLNMKKKLGAISPEDYIKHKKELKKDFRKTINSLRTDLMEYKKL